MSLNKCPPPREHQKEARANMKPIKKTTVVICMLVCFFVAIAVVFRREFAKANIGPRVRTNGQLRRRKTAQITPDGHNARNRIWRTETDGEWRLRSSCMDEYTKWPISITRPHHARDCCTSREHIGAWSWLRSASLLDESSSPVGRNLEFWENQFNGTSCECSLC